jgi:hypothetical protein
MCFQGSQTGLDKREGEWLQGLAGSKLDDLSMQLDGKNYALEDMT